MRQASIFVVEDETLIRMMLVQMVEELGHRVVAEAASVHDGRSRAEIENYDLAILDINLQGFNVQPVAQAISRRGLPDGFRGWPVLDKPCTSEVLKTAIDAVLSIGGPGAQDESGQASQT